MSDLSDEDRAFLRRSARNLDTIGRLIARSEDGAIRVTMGNQTPAQIGRDFRLGASRLLRIADPLPSRSAPPPPDPDDLTEGG